MSPCIGCYIRLSHADEDKNKQNESNSVHNQRELIQHYILTHSEFRDWSIQEFIDDGFTGTNENRPEFQHMINLIHLNQIHCVIVKDFSRFARNYLIMGNYLEQVFPLLGVRFIAINDGYDSATSVNSLDAMSMTLKSILHSYYSKDLSAKIFATNTQRMKSGQFVGTPCYGYMLSADRTRQIIDPESAGIVRMIFDMALAGKTRPEIVKYLNDQKMPTPAEYNNHMGRRKSNMITQHPLWDHGKVSRILRQEEYTGKLIMRKNIQPVPCVKKYRKTTPEEQFVRESAHEAIVTQEEFDRVQAMIPRKKGWDRRNQHMYPLKKLVRCGTCGKVMCFSDTPSPGGFRCKDALIEHSVCSPRIHPMDEVEKVVHQKIKHLLPLIKEQQAHRNNQPANVCISDHSQLQLLRQKLLNLKYRKVRIYEQYIARELSLEDYLSHKHSINQSELELQQHIAALEQQTATPSVVIPPSELVTAMGDVKRFDKTSELTSEMARSFIDAVFVFDDCIRISWKYPWLGELEEA